MSIEQVRSAPLAYLATPYTKYTEGIEQAFIDAAKLKARLMRAGINVYSPIVESHPSAIYGDLDPLDHSIWLRSNEAQMAVASVLIVAQMDGWDRSKGVLHEIEFFQARSKPIFMLDPETLGMSRLHLIAVTNLICKMRELQSPALKVERVG